VRGEVVTWFAEAALTAAVLFALLGTFLDAA
jgi:hypothetical protein